MNEQRSFKLIFLALSIGVSFWFLAPSSAGIDPRAEFLKTHSRVGHGTADSKSPAGTHSPSTQGRQEPSAKIAGPPVVWSTTLAGTCVNCHTGISAPHAKQAIKCVDCHGGNDKVETGPNPNIRDKNLMGQAHVRPKEPRFFWANGIDDEFAGKPGKGVTEFDAFNNNVDPVDNTGMAGTHIDAEYSRDLNYVRFINPSDYRVAMISCGNLSPALGSPGQCHGSEVETVRKSIMATNQGQFATATYANHSPQGATNANPLGTNPTGRADPRDGEVCITFNYDDIDGAYNPKTNQIDGAKLRAIAKTDDDPFNDTFEAIGAPLIDRDGQKVTAVHGDNLVNGFPTHRLRGIGGKKIIPQAIPRAQKMILPWSRRDALHNPDDPVSSLIQTVFNLFGVDNTVAQHPIDAGFNGVRAFDPGLFPDVNENFAFPADDNLPDRTALAESRSADPPDNRSADVSVANKEFVPPNPFNRNRNSGCSSCHMLYRPDGNNEEPFDQTVRLNGRNPSTDPFTGMHEDKGERGYPALHQLTTKIPTNQCGICHVFTTRVDVAFKGTFEIENNNFNFRWSTTAADPSLSADGKTKINFPLQFTNKAGTRISMFDNLATVDKDGTRIINPGERATEDLNNNGVLDAGEDSDGNGVLDIPDRLQRSDAQDGRQMRIMYGGASGAVRLQDIHVEKGMECIDCHFFQDLHGDGNIYTRNWDTIEIECVDCHGTAKKLANLRTSGPNGGNDLKQSLDENGDPFFEVRGDGSRIQRSRVKDGLSWRIPQVREAITKGNQHFNQEAFEAMGVRSSSNPKEFAHINKSREEGKLECYTCHNAATPQCFACHYQQEYFPVPNPANKKFTDGQARRNDEQMMEIWMGEKFVPFPNFFFFGIVRSPFVMGVNGNTEFNKLSPFRSIMELNFSVAGPDGNTVVHNTSFTATTHDLFTGDRPRSGSTLNPYMPHTVRLEETKDCDVCHTLRDGSGNIINNNLLAGSFGLGTGRYHDIGDWVFAPLQGPKPSLLLMDIKKENAVIVNEVDAPQKVGDTQPVTQDQIVASRKLRDNVFPGFNVDNTQIRRVEFDGTQDAIPFVNPRDTALIRNYTAKDHVIRGADLTFVADGTGGLKIVLVTVRDKALNETIRKNLGPTIIGVVPTTNAQGVDVVSSDLSDEYVYLADGQAGVKVVYVHEVFTAGASIAGQVATSGFANKVRIAGNFLYVADGPAGLTVVDVTDRNHPKLVKTVGSNGNALDVAVYGAFAFVANGNNGMAVYDISDEHNPKLATVFNAGGVINDARGLDYADNRVYIADGVNGLRIIDITTPAVPKLLLTVNKGEKGDPINDAQSVAMATVPFRTFAMVCDGANGLRAVNVTDFRDIRERLFPGSSAFPGDKAAPHAVDAIDQVFQSGFNLTLALRDPLTPYDRANLKFNAGQVADPPFQIITFPVGPGQRLLSMARGRQLDKLGDEDGRTLRDSTSVGARALSRDEMDKMRSVNVVVQPGTVDESGNGLGNIVLQGGASASMIHAHGGPHGLTAKRAAEKQHPTRAAVSPRKDGGEHVLLNLMLIGIVITPLAVRGIRRGKRRPRS
jgi:LVIVD repeat